MLVYSYRFTDGDNPISHPSLRISTESFSSQALPDMFVFNRINIYIDSKHICDITNITIAHCANDNINSLFGWLHEDARFVITIEHTIFYSIYICFALMYVCN